MDLKIKNSDIYVRNVVVIILEDKTDIQNISEKKAIQLYLEGNGFRRIERILKVSHVSVINWVKKAGAKLEKISPKNEKVEVLELDELCVNKKKHLAVDSSRSCNKATYRL